MLAEYKTQPISPASLERMATENVLAFAKKSHGELRQTYAPRWATLAGAGPGSSIHEEILSALDDVSGGEDHDLRLGGHHGDCSRTRSSKNY